MEKSTKRYVYENVEVKLTGRVAQRKLRSGKSDTKYEITPANQKDGTWQKWVRLQELFEVQETNGE